MMDKSIWKILAISVILAIVASSMAIYSTANLEKEIDKKEIDEGGGKGVISLVASSFIGVAGASPAGGGSGSGGGAALEAGMTFLEEEVGISAYANVGAEGMLTYTNEEYGFSIEYPEDWKVFEDYKGCVVAFIELDSRINVIVLIQELPTEMTAYEYAKDTRGGFPEEYTIVKTFNDTINSEPVSGIILTVPMEGGLEAKVMQAYFISDTTAYVIGFSATSSTYDEAEEDYFDPILRSFKFIEKEAGIEIRVFIVTPSKVEAGEEVKIKFEAVNEADVEKTKTFLLRVIPPGTLLPEAIDFKTVTLAPGERVEIEFTFIPKETGEHTLYVESEFWVIAVDHEKEAGIEILVKNPLEVLEGENFTATVNIANASDLTILLFKLKYDPSVVSLNKIEKGVSITTSNWPHWYSSQNRGMVTIFASSDPSGSPVNGSGELARLEFSVVGSAGDKSALDIHGIIGNSDMESIQAIWVDSEVTVIPSEYL